MAKNYAKIAKDKYLEAGKLMTKTQKVKCNIVIHLAAVICGVCGFIPLPVADAIPIAITQVIMILLLGAILEHGITMAFLKGMFYATAATFIGRALVQLIPVVGAIVSTGVAFVVTEAVGWSIAVDMAKSFRTEWERQKNAKDAADAYAEAEYYKKALDNDDSEAEDFSEP